MQVVFVVFKLVHCSHLSVIMQRKLNCIVLSGLCQKVGCHKGIFFKLVVLTLLAPLDLKIYLRVC